jgi:hypothetical protein
MAAAAAHNKNLSSNFVVFDETLLKILEVNGARPAK